jgi:hypothetical protein
MSPEYTPGGKFVGMTRWLLYRHYPAETMRLQEWTHKVYARLSRGSAKHP